MGNKALGSPFEFYQFKSGAYDFWRCYSCHRLFTYEQERSLISRMETEPNLTMCSCRSMRYSPTRPSYFEWLRPDVIAYVLKLVLARGLAPWVEKHFPRALPWIERLCRPMEA